jgi:hypothetical protein
MTDSKRSLTPKKAMMQTFEIIWKHASQTEREYIKEMWGIVMKPARVLSWQPFHSENEYEMELEQEIVGSHPEIPLGEVIVERKMKIAFSEEKVPGKKHYRQVISFPDQGIRIRVGIGWLSKESPLERIFIEEKGQEIWCHVEAMGQSLSRSADETLAFWNKTKWNV